MPPKKSSLVPRRATLRDVGLLAKVDPSLVSRVLNNDPNATASAATKSRILSAAKKLNYTTNFSARNLKMAKTLTIGLLLPDLTNPVNDLVAHGVQEGAAELGYGVVIANHSDIGGDKTISQMLTQGHVDGIIAFVHSINDSLLENLSKNSNGRILPMNGKIKGIECSVSLDDPKAAEMCVEHLVDLGHKKIVGIFGSTTNDSPRRRVVGFKKACAKYNIQPNIVFTQGYSAHDGYLATLEAITKYSPTAIFPSSNSYALGTYRALYEKKFRIPEDISVITLHNSAITEFLSPPLTSVRLPAEEMGKVSAEKLIDMLNGKKVKHFIVDGKPSLVIRGSTARLNS
ncbi:MAG: LacI family DNA-binding transcriptional regulator [Actinobacteria bacterium]|nr:LacI family DNA-binding transcriptional regulator [Actinomycetota bacterium]